MTEEGGADYVPAPRLIAVGPQQGRKAFMIRTIRPLDRPDAGLERVAKANGFSLHAGVSCEGHQKDKWERLCRYIARPAERHAAMTWAQRLKRVFNIDIEVCGRCGGAVKPDRRRPAAGSSPPVVADSR